MKVNPAAILAAVAAEPAEGLVKPRMESLNFLTFHRDELRHQYFAGTGSRSVTFDSRTKSWIITDPVQCRELISSSKLVPATYAEDYQAISDRFGVDFSNLIFAFNFIPLCLHGDRHAQIRLAASKFLAGRRESVESQLPVMVTRHFSALRRTGPLEIMSMIVKPIVHEFTCLVAGIEPEDAVDCHYTSQIFDKSSNLSRRKAMEMEISSLRKKIMLRSANGADEEVGLRLAYFILGKDPLMGMLGESLRTILTSNPGRMLAEIEYSDTPPETGVPFIERIVVEPFSVDETEFKPGERVRIFLQSFSYPHSPLGRSNFFGAGAHACLGRPLSMAFWKGVTDYLAASWTRVTLVSSTQRTSDYVFTCPDVLNVEVGR